MTAARRRTAFAGALAALAAANVALHWPRDLGQAHWSEWVVFYATPPLVWAGLAAALAFVIKRIAKGSWAGQMPLLWIWAFALLLTVMAAM